MDAAHGGRLGAGWLMPEIITLPPHSIIQQQLARSHPSLIIIPRPAAMAIRERERDRTRSAFHKYVSGGVVVIGHLDHSGRRVMCPPMRDVEAKQAKWARNLSPDIDLVNST
jgi:hypothetical protein